MPGLIFTKHAIERNRERNISHSIIDQAFNNPDGSSKIEDQKTEYKKRFGDQTVTLVTKKNESGESLLLSAWIDPPNPGTRDFKNNMRYREMKKASTIRKVWLTLRNQIGI